MNFKYLYLYIPWIISIVIPNPQTSFLIAWIGSFFIFYMSMSGRIKPLPTDIPINQQILRPLFLVQAIFAGYMACSSIFYFLDSIGYTYFSYTGTYNAINKATPQTVTACQQYYVLGHAALAHGILAAMKYPVKKNVEISIKSFSRFFITIGIICLPLSFLLSSFSGLSQFGGQAAGLSFVACTLAFSTAIGERNKMVILLSGIFYLLNFAKAAVSGFKEPVIISILLLGIFLFPIYGKKLLVIFIPLIIIAFGILPTYVATFRQASWALGQSSEQAKEMALRALQESQQLSETNWHFLVNRISEISMFVVYREHIPARHPYYGAQILEQSLFAIVPRVFWPTKRNTEELVSERVYEANVVDPNALVSAKPAFIVDAYLSGGNLIILITLFLYGFVAQFIAMKAEEMFGGFLLGTALVFTGMFGVFWRGSCFEFLINTTFWCYIGMYIFYFILVKRKILVPIE
ncbi:MAG: hypothetical protein WKF91_22090 [Segetibacter sp.]